MGYILGIDTSNYKTSIAVIDHKKHIICDLRRFLTVKQGERGLRQSDALFQHIQNLPELMAQIAAQGVSGKTFALCMKGIEVTTLRRLSEIAEEAVGGSNDVAGSCAGISRRGTQLHGD